MRMFPSAQTVQLLIRDKTPRRDLEGEAKGFKDVNQRPWKTWGNYPANETVTFHSKTQRTTPPTLDCKGLCSSVLALISKAFNPRHLKVSLGGFVMNLGYPLILKFHSCGPEHSGWGIVSLQQTWFAARSTHLEDCRLLVKESAHFHV